MPPLIQCFLAIYLFIYLVICLFLIYRLIVLFTVDLFLLQLPKKVASTSTAIPIIHRLAPDFDMENTIEFDNSAFVTDYGGVFDIYEKEGF